jgi:hypothetical protein
MRQRADMDAVMNSVTEVHGDDEEGEETFRSIMCRTIDVHLCLMECSLPLSDQEMRETTAAQECVLFITLVLDRRLLFT